MINTVEEQIRLYARQLKIPTFGDYAEVLRHCAPDTDFAGFLLELMAAETESRQQNHSRTVIMIQTYLITVLFFFTPYAEKAVDTTAFPASFKRIHKNDGPGGVISTGAFLRSALRRSSAARVFV